MALSSQWDFAFQSWEVERDHRLGGSCQQLTLLGQGKCNLTNSLAHHTKKATQDQHRTSSKLSLAPSIMAALDRKKDKKTPV